MFPFLAGALLCPLLLTVSAEVGVHIHQGAIVGFKHVAEDGSFFDAFLGIPYSKAPIGELRFRDPLPHPGWTGKVFAADKYGPLCPQFNKTSNKVIGDEDCLTLNVFTPMVQSSYAIQLMPVMVYVHGGGFMKGASFYHGPGKLLKEPIVLITINYRLGVLGFLSTEDEFGPGNYGMMDLVLGLRWVNENVRFFNGDARRVTIFGESAGAAAVSLLMLSPLTRGLFWMAITQSGSALCDWAVEEEPYSYALSVASALQCETHSTGSIVQCLRHRSVEDIVRAQQSQLKFSYFPMRAVPIVDRGYRKTPFLPYAPEEVMKSKNYSQVPLITGVVTHEGLQTAINILDMYSSELKSDPNFFENVILPMMIEVMAPKLYTPKKIEQIKHFYFKNVNLHNLNQILPPFIDLLSDIMFFRGNDKTIKLHSKHAPVYSYVFSYRGNQTYSRKVLKYLAAVNISSSLLETGVGHVDDLLYLFSLPNFKKMDKWPFDNHVQNIMISLWTTFAQQGTPNRLTAINDQNKVFWKNAEESSMFYLDINAYPTIKQHFRKFELAVFDYISISSPYSALEAYVAEAPRRPYYVATWVLLTMLALLIVALIVFVVLLLKAQNQKSYSPNSKNELDPYG